MRQLHSLVDLEHCGATRNTVVFKQEEISSFVGQVEKGGEGVGEGVGVGELVGEGVKV